MSGRTPTPALALTSNLQQQQQQQRDGNNKKEEEREWLQRVMGDNANVQALEYLLDGNDDNGGGGTTSSSSLNYPGTATTVDESGLSSEADVTAAATTSDMLLMGLQLDDDDDDDDENNLGGSSNRYTATRTRMMQPEDDENDENDDFDENAYEPVILRTKHKSSRSRSRASSGVTPPRVSRKTSTSSSSKKKLSSSSPATRRRRKTSSSSSTISHRRSAEKQRLRAIAFDSYDNVNEEKKDDDDDLYVVPSKEQHHEERKIEQLKHDLMQTKSREEEVVQALELTKHKCRELESQLDTTNDTVVLPLQKSLERVTAERDEAILELVAIQKTWSDRVENAERERNVAMEQVRFLKEKVAEQKKKMKKQGTSPNDKLSQVAANAAAAAAAEIGSTKKTKKLSPQKEDASALKMELLATKTELAMVQEKFMILHNSPSRSPKRNHPGGTDGTAAGAGAASGQFPFGINPSESSLSSGQNAELLQTSMELAENLMDLLNTPYNQDIPMTPLEDQVLEQLHKVSQILGKDDDLEALALSSGAPTPVVPEEEAPATTAKRDPEACRTVDSRTPDVDISTPPRTTTCRALSPAITRELEALGDDAAAPKEDRGWMEYWMEKYRLLEQERDQLLESMVGLLEGNRAAHDAAMDAYRMECACGAWNNSTNSSSPEQFQLTMDGEADQSAAVVPATADKGVNEPEEVSGTNCIDCCGAKDAVALESKDPPLPPPPQPRPKPTVKRSFNLNSSILMNDESDDDFDSDSETEESSASESGRWPLTTIEEVTTIASTAIVDDQQQMLDQNMDTGYIGGKNDNDDDDGIPSLTSARTDTSEFQWSAKGDDDDATLKRGTPTDWLVSDVEDTYTISEEQDKRTAPRASSAVTPTSS